MAQNYAMRQHFYSCSSITTLDTCTTFQSSVPGIHLNIVMLGQQPTGQSPSDHTSYPPRSPATEVAAFFDLDKTIIATSSAYAFGKEFMHNGLISTTEALAMSWAKGTYMVAGLTSEEMDNSRDQLANLVAGWDVEEVSRIVTEAITTVVTPVIYAEARELIQQHQAAGHAVIIISASATQLVEPIAAELGVDQVVATELEIRDGRFTGEILFYNKGDAKADAIDYLAATHGYDLALSYAYSDSATDIPMLQQVGHPVAVNPDRQLKKFALEQGWDVRSFKDPVPLFPLPRARDVGIGAGVLALIAAFTAGGLWLAQRGRNGKHSA